MSRNVKSITFMLPIKLYKGIFTKYMLRFYPIAKLYVNIGRKATGLLQQDRRAAIICSDMVIFHFLTKTDFF